MSDELELRCACGAVRGVVVESSPRTCNHAMCYCDDCQAFARFLGRDDVMNERGGTDIVQVAPSRVRIAAGHEHLRSMRLSPKGVLRWYTGCCRSPAGNMLSTPRSPFIGFPTRFIALEGRALDAVVGPSEAIQGRFAIGGRPEGVAARVSLGLLARSVRMVLGNALRGRHRPSPFWTATGQPIAAPQVLAPEERAPLYRVSADAGR